MNKYKYIISLILSLIILPSIVYADCTKEELEHFKEIQNKYNYTYKFDEQTKKYTISFHSEEPDKYSYGIVKTQDFECISDNEKEFTCYNIEPGTYEIRITGMTDICSGMLKKDKIQLAKYNEYSNDPLCEGIEEFVLCQKTYDKDIDYDTFVSRVNTYKKTKKEQETASSAGKEENNQILSFIADNMFKIILVIVFSIVVIISIAISIKSVKKSRRLEWKK